MLTGPFGRSGSQLETRIHCTDGNGHDSLASRGWMERETLVK